MRCTAKDIRWLNRFFAAEEMWQAAKCDAAPEAWRYVVGEKLIEDERIYVLCPRRGCVFIARPLFPPLAYECHTFVEKGLRGEKAVEAARLAMAWLFAHTRCRKLVGFTPAPYRAARLFAFLCGFRQEGRLTNSFQKEGKLYDRIVFGLSQNEE